MIPLQAADGQEAGRQKASFFHGEAERLKPFRPPERAANNWAFWDRGKLDCRHQSQAPATLGPAEALLELASVQQALARPQLRRRSGSNLIRQKLGHGPPLLIRRDE